MANNIDCTWADIRSLHTKSLGVLRTERLPDGRVVEVVEKTWEQRYTNFGQAVLTGVVLIRPLITVLGTIPNAALAPRPWSCRVPSSGTGPGPRERPRRVCICFSYSSPVPGPPA